MSRADTIVRVLPRTAITWAIVAANVAAFLIAFAVAGCNARTLLDQLSIQLEPVVIRGCDYGLALVEMGAKFNPAIAHGEYWRLLAAAFLHLNLMHLLFNMFALLAFGRLAEMIFGHARYAAIYLVSALSSSLLSYELDTPISVGASGAFFGIAGALILFFFLNRRVRAIAPGGQLAGLFGLLLINAVFGFTVQNVDNLGHAGGLIGGAIVGGVLSPRIVPVSGEDGKPIGLRKQMSPSLAWLVLPAALALIAVIVLTIPGAGMRR